MSDTIITDDTPSAPEPAETVAPTPAASPRDDLDDLLADYASQSPAKPEAVPGPSPEPERPERLTDPSQVPDNSELTTEALQVLREHHVRERMERDGKDADLAVAHVRGDASDFAPSMVRGWLQEQAANDPKVADAWANRYENPQAYAQTVERLARRFHAEHVSIRIDPAATTDRAMVAASVRGAGAPPPAETDAAYRARVSRMSDAEFQRLREEAIGG